MNLQKYLKADHLVLEHHEYPFVVVYDEGPGLRDRDLEEGSRLRRLECVNVGAFFNPDLVAVLPLREGVPKV